MAASTTPIFLTGALLGWATLTTGSNIYDGTGTVATIFTAGSEAARLEHVRIRSLSSNVATVLRLFINNSLTNSTASNNSLIQEMTIASSSTSAVAALAANDYFFNIVIPATYKLTAVIGTTVAGGIQVTAFGGTY